MPTKLSEKLWWVGLVLLILSSQINHAGLRLVAYSVAAVVIALYVHNIKNALQGRDKEDDL